MRRLLLAGMLVVSVPAHALTLMQERPAPSLIPPRHHSKDWDAGFCYGYALAAHGSKENIEHYRSMLNAEQRKLWALSEGLDLYVEVPPISGHGEINLPLPGTSGGSKRVDVKVDCSAKP